jgi:hypothetical protein
MSEAKKEALFSEGLVKCEGQGCTKKGYYRYGVCANCRPKCTVCGRSINNRNYGETKHLTCTAAKFRADNADNTEMFKPKGRTPHAPSAQ